MLSKQPDLQILNLPLAGGVDETSPSTELAPDDYLNLTNYRISKDGKRLAKRLGSTDQGISAGEDIYGYFTYWDSSDNFCQLQIKESKVTRKVGDGSWTDIHTWGTNLSHPLKPIMAQGKVFLIQEEDSRMIHTDGSDYQIGIDAPSTIPTLTAGAGGSMAEGTYRYAVTYVRSGNYGCESNPVRALVGSASFTGSGLDDCTPGGTYTGTDNKSVRVRIDGTGTPDTFEYSLDGGSTWESTDIPITTTSYLSYGITLTWGATTGHTLGDYWDFTASALAVDVTDNQQVTLSSIPTSSDTQVDQRKIYRTVLGGSQFFYLATIPDNTTTSFVDNIGDAALGISMEIDHDVAPNGKFAAWWDNRLWISGDNIVYYSEISVPEEFYITKRYVKMHQAVATAGMSESNDEITGLVPYKDNLYVFKRNSVYVIQALADGTYGRYLCNKDFGCIAPWSMVEANNLLMFLSYRGIELYNGCDSYASDFSLRVSTTLGTVDTTKYDLISSAHNRPYHEILFNFPDTSGSAVMVVYNYLKDKWYFFTHHKTFSALSESRNSDKAQRNWLCTRDGYLWLMDSGYQDDSTSFTATARKGWVKAGATMHYRRVDVEYELPTSMTLTINVYADFEKDAKFTRELKGSTPSATDIEYRRPKYDFREMGVNAQHLSVEFVNSENVGGDLKINACSLYAAPIAVKGGKKGD